MATEILASNMNSSTSEFVSLKTKNEKSEVKSVSELIHFGNFRTLQSFNFLSKDKPKIGKDMEEKFITDFLFLTFNP